MWTDQSCLPALTVRYNRCGTVDPGTIRRDDEALNLPFPGNPRLAGASKMAKEPVVTESADNADSAGSAAGDQPNLAEQARLSEEARTVEQARAGDMAAFSRLVTEYQDRVLNACWRITGHYEDAQDLTQEAFLQALEKIDTFQQKASFYTWLFRIAVNLSISHRRRSARTTKLSLHGGDGGASRNPRANDLASRVANASADPPNQLSAREVERCVVENLNQLDDDHRAVLVLRDIEAFDYQQIAEILEISIGTVKSRLHRARIGLRERLKTALVTDEH